MKVIIDAFGGDNAPLSVVEGTVNAVSKLNVNVILTGNEEALRKIFKENNFSMNNIEIVNTEEVITMEDDPVTAVRTKKNSSLVVGTKLLAEGKGDAFLSAGNTGAVLTAATLIVGRIKGIKRPALAPVIPAGEGVAMLIDCGANVECTAEFLHQFAIMGSIYMNNMFCIGNPRVGLLNNGTEEGKGTALQIETYKILKESNLNFVGNVEGKEFMLGACDVIVSDGYSGNIMLKTIEGTAKMLMKEIKGILYASFLSKLSALFVKKGLKTLKMKMDVSEYGGVPLLGVSKPVIKAHGSSDARAIESAIKQAVKCYQSDIISKIAQNVAEIV